MDDDQLWKVTGAATGVVTAILVRKVLAAAWKQATGGEPPSNPAAPQITWGRALLWAGISGMVLAVARTLVEWGAAEAWKAAKGDYPSAIYAAEPS